MHALKLVTRTKHVCSCGLPRGVTLVRRRPYQSTSPPSNPVNKFISSPSYKDLLENNKIWAALKKSEDPDYFTKLAAIQTPRILWIGCSDSRVPPNETTGTSPGEIFVHRNVANQVVPSDINLTSVLQYGVEVLQIPDIIVCGHYGCGGVRVAMGNTYNGLIDKWLRPIKDIYVANRDELEALKDPIEREKRLVELNVERQVYRLAESAIIQRSWKRHGALWNDLENAFPRLHGWVFDLNTGLIKELPIDLTRVPDIYRLDVDDDYEPTGFGRLDYGH